MSNHPQFSAETPNFSLSEKTPAEQRLSVLAASQVVLAPARAVTATGAGVVAGEVITD